MDEVEQAIELAVTRVKETIPNITRQGFERLQVEYLAAGSAGYAFQALGVDVLGDEWSAAFTRAQARGDHVHYDNRDRHTAYYAAANPVAVLRNLPNDLDKFVHVEMLLGPWTKVMEPTLIEFARSIMTDRDVLLAASTLGDSLEALTAQVGRLRKAIQLEAL